jgi:citrate lyase subunit beta/citryl-CoA lyase
MIRKRLRRSELSTPGWSEKMITKAAASSADLVFLDLEDSVAESLKPAARDTIVSALTELDWGKKTRAVRINAPGTEWALDDLTAVVSGAGAHLDVVIVPKVMSAADVRLVDAALSELERTLGRVTPIGIEVLIEEVEALIAVEAIAASSPRLETLIFGSGDMAASLGIRTGWLGEYPGDPWIYHRSRIVVAARAAGLDAIDGPYWGALDDSDGYTRECRAVSTLGYTGKWAIHPAQIAPANATFAPSPAEIVRARRVIEACAVAATEGRGAIALDGVMVDAVDVRLAESVIRAHEAIGYRQPHGVE